jgi:uncharacterized SAM-binding protein YcdF (DUF218 family)
MSLLKAISTPIIWILLLIIAGTIVLRRLCKHSKLRVGWYLIVFGICILLFLSLGPISNLLVYSLESQYEAPPKEVITKVNIMVILGGGFCSSGGFRKSPEASGTTYSRMFNGVKFFKQDKTRVLVLSGAGRKSDGETEAEVMKDLAIALGVSEDKIITECKSRNTIEHAIELAKIFPPTEKLYIGIVTSALHIPRAVQAFRKEYSQDEIIPIPVGYIYTPPVYNFKSIIPSVDAFVKSSYAIHEWIGMAWYSILF